MTDVPGAVLSNIRFLQAGRTGARQKVPVQKQAVDPGRNDEIIMFIAFSLGKVPPHQGCGKTASAA